MPHLWLAIDRADLKTQWAQCRDEGMDLTPFAEEFKALDIPGLADDPKLQKRAGHLLDRTTRLRLAKSFSFIEPSRLDEIVQQRGRGVVLPADPPVRRVLLDKIHGAWVGRCCGCMLGKPVEGRRRGEIEKYLRAQGRWPLDFYFSKKTSDAVRKATNMPLPPTQPDSWFAEGLACMVEDDDTNYTTVGLAVVKKHGRDFTPADVANFWLGNLALLHTCTAERVAYKNAANLLPVPDRRGRFAGPFSTASYRNPYREWIGAQIRADFFGYCHPGQPQQAAEFAWRDACISHVKNGIYGEMWVAAMLAAAAVCDDLGMVIRAGLAGIPARSRLVRDIERVFQWRREGLTYKQAVDAVHKQWDETSAHHWCHTNSNAQIVALALLWGGHDYEQTICGAVTPGFDTDCNAATAGSVLGMILGRKALPGKWTRPIRDTLQTGVHGYYEVKLEDMARETVELAEKLRG